MELKIDKFYCYKCYKLGIITELKDDSNNDNLLITHSHGESPTYRGFISWCEHCNDFTFKRGSNKNNICRLCTTKDMQKRGIFNDPNFGLNNPETHKKTIEAQLKNGTGACGDPKVREKSRKSFLENQPWNKDDNWGFKNKETWKKTIESRDNHAKEKGYKNYIEYQRYINDQISIEEGYQNWQDKIDKTGLDFGKGVELKFCKKCKNITRHIGYKCFICYPEISPNKDIFLIKNDVLFYYCKNNHKYIPWDEFKNTNNINDSTVVQKIIELELEPIIVNQLKLDYPNHKEFQNYNGLFLNCNGKEYYWYKKKYILWNKFISEFKIRNIDFTLFEGFEMFSTFRTQDSKNWYLAKTAFEHNLVKNEVGWFVYIKFDELNKPLVVGKSGSLIVNTKGSDVSFDLNPENGPARRFLIEEGLDWCKTQIAVLKCNSEKEAYRIEKEIQEKYKLFGS